MGEIFLPKAYQTTFWEKNKEKILPRTAPGTKWEKNCVCEGDYTEAPVVIKF